MVFLLENLLYIMCSSISNIYFIMLSCLVRGHVESQQDALIHETQVMCYVKNIPIMITVNILFKYLLHNEVKLSVEKY